MDIEELPIENMGSHWGKRVIGFIIDLIIATAICGILLWGIGFLSFDIIWILTLFAFFTGIIYLLYAGFVEGAAGSSIGKWAMGFEVVAIDDEMGVVKGFLRNLSKVWWIITLADWGGGWAVPGGDPRQKGLDRAAGTLVVQAFPVEVPAQRMPYIAPLPQKEEEDEGPEWEIPKELLSGVCSLCSTPYKVLPPEDKRSWSGLWNSRCIWCNKLVFEDYKKRKRPDTWETPRPESWRASHTQTWRRAYPAWR